MVAIDDVVVPVSLPRLESRALEFEGTLPATGFGRGLVLGKWKLSGVVVPRPEEMDGLDTRRCAQSKR